MNANFFCKTFIVSKAARLALPIRFARWAGFHCLVSGAIGSANALYLPVKEKRNEVKLSHYFSD